MTLTTLIIDDEKLARQELRYLLDSLGEVEVLAEAPTVSRPSSSSMSTILTWSSWMFKCLASMVLRR